MKNIPYLDPECTMHSKVNSVLLLLHPCSEIWSYFQHFQWWEVSEEHLRQHAITFSHDWPQSHKDEKYNINLTKEGKRAKVNSNISKRYGGLKFLHQMCPIFFISMERKTWNSNTAGFTYVSNYIYNHHQIINWLLVSHLNFTMQLELVKHLRFVGIIFVLQWA